MLTRCTLVCLILVFTFLKGSKNLGILIECGNNWQAKLQFITLDFNSSHHLAFLMECVNERKSRQYCTLLIIENIFPKGHEK